MHGKTAFIRTPCLSLCRILCWSVMMQSVDANAWIVDAQCIGVSIVLCSTAIASIRLARTADFIFDRWTCSAVFTLLMYVKFNRTYFSHHLTNAHVMISIWKINCPTFCYGLVFVCFCSSSDWYTASCHIFHEKCEERGYRRQWNKKHVFFWCTILVSEHGSGVFLF